VSARAAKRELAEALRGYPWERWSTRSVVWAAGMLARNDPARPLWRVVSLARALGLDPRLVSSGVALGSNLIVRLESAAYLLEHAGEAPKQADPDEDLTIEDDYEDLSTS
jgi:hypothetical protein